MSVPRHNNTLVVLSLFALVASTALASNVFGQVPESFGFSGYLETEDGPVNDQVEVEVRILMSENARSAEVTEVHRFVDVIDGQFTLEIGSVELLDIGSLGDEWVLEFVVDGDVLSPPIRPSSVPYAQVANTALNSEGVFVGDYQVIDGDGNWTGEAVSSGSSLENLGCSEGETAVAGADDWACVALPAQYAQIDSVCPSEEVMRGIDDQGEPLCVDMPDSIGEGSNDHIGPEAIADMATKTWVAAQGYTTSSDIAGLATESYVDSAVSSVSGVDLDDYATKAYVDGQNFLTDSDISGLASRSYVDGQNFLTDSDISGLATRSYVDGLDFVTDSELESANYASESYVTSRGYVTQTAGDERYAPLASTASQDWVTEQLASNAAPHIRYFELDQPEAEQSYNPNPAVFHLGLHQEEIFVPAEIMAEYCGDEDGCDIRMTSTPVSGTVQNGASRRDTVFLDYDAATGMWSSNQRFAWHHGIHYFRFGSDSSDSNGTDLAFLLYTETNGTYSNHSGLYDSKADSDDVEMGFWFRNLQSSTRTSDMTIFD